MLKKLTVLAVGWGLSWSALAADVATLTKQAEKGDVNAQMNLADYYVDKKDYINEYIWEKRLANQGYAIYQYNLAQMYRKGQGVNQNYATAFQWYQKSANQGYASA